MTKEQAREILVNATFSDEWQGNEELTTAYHMAIKSLEQEPSEDCVSREQAIVQLSIDLSEIELPRIKDSLDKLSPVTPAQRWIPLVWDEYPTVDIDGNDDWVYAVDYNTPMPKEDEWVLITDEDQNVRIVQYDGYDFGDYVREHILAWQPLPQPYEEKRGSENDRQ